MQLSGELREVLVAAFPKSVRGVSVLDREGMTLVWSLLDELLRVALLPPPAAPSSADETQHNDKKRHHTTGHLDGVVAEQRWRDLFLQHHVEPEKEGREPGPTGHPQALVDTILSVLRAGKEAAPGDESGHREAALNSAQALLLVGSRVAQKAQGLEPDWCVLARTNLALSARGDPALASLFQHSACLRVQPAALVALCAQIIVDEEVDYHNNAELPDEVVKAIEKVDTRVKMERLLERIEACLPDLKAKLTPATDEELSAVKKKFCLWFPPELEAFFKWSNGVPREAPGMIRFINCASLAEIDEEFHYSEFFPHLFRRMIVQIDNECQTSHLISPSFIGSVQAYVEALEQHKDNPSALETVHLPKVGGKLSVEAPEIYADFLKTNPYGED
ncbi:uncharacterized protein ACA1_373750 [Acanthamoeba castellanii str. Neff]|uniref:Uncharacterized protein n=1 Tax=Acanthamoeba castellanii (strain ATCC 30010 / Neff) TaxID=1257118 RepID=L8GJE2_ACACF|nr:uncharacterized protein ACA1_373750 [Acanthamoeba castellanii str. Neff]ELR12311.1 hypothetical protein ACA1_373750 [Acanthamoeba castellanii str. Neff]